MWRLLLQNTKIPFMIRGLGIFYYSPTVGRIGSSVGRKTVFCNLYFEIKTNLNWFCGSVHQVAGIKGMLIANKRQDSQVKTYITYNKGRDWRLLQAPASDLDGNDVHCILVKYCAVYLQTLSCQCCFCLQRCDVDTAGGDVPGVIRGYDLKLTAFLYCEPYKH